MKKLRRCESEGLECYTGKMTCRKAIEELRQMEQTPAISKAIQIMETQLRQLDREKRKRMIGAIK